MRNSPAFPPDTAVPRFTAENAQRVDAALAGDADQAARARATESRLRAGRPMIWFNTHYASASAALADVQARRDLGLGDIVAADQRLRGFAPMLARLFPELGASAGLIESELVEPADASALTGVGTSGRTLIKADHALPVAGSIKARGGFHEVLAHAQDLAAAAGIGGAAEDPYALLQPEARALFARHCIGVGSTGNLGLSIGIMAAALGFRAVVHMSQEAKAWKKALLRARGATVVEHRGDYAAAVAAGRREAQASADAYFVDDENSLRLFLGYATAALRLREQLRALGIEVSARHPLCVYLPCGVGGAPGGITFGLKHVYGDAVYCFFAEPCASPAMLARMACGHGPVSVYELGLDNATIADGLAVPQASELVHDVVRDLVAGIYTVADDELLRALARLHRTNGMRIEPSAAAGFPRTGLVAAS